MLVEKRGYCHADDKIKIALVSTHYYEEPPISGNKGSGTIFFSNCNLNCVYCQNYDISQESKGLEVDTTRLAEIMIEQQERGVNNINLVTPTMYVYQIIDAIKIAKKNGLKIPIVYNTNSYESLDTIKMLDGYIDIYLPDLKYADDNLAIGYSKAPNYFKVATENIKEMERQVGKAIFNKDGIMQKGIIVRHLILPNEIENSKAVLKWISENLSKDTFISIMAQYFPTYKAKDIERLNRKITKEEYEEVENYMYSLGFENGYMQDLGEHEEEFVPDFNCQNVTKM